MTVSSWPLLPGVIAQAAGSPFTETESMVWPSVSRLNADRSWVAFAFIRTTAVKSYVTGVKSKVRS